MAPGAAFPRRWCSGNVRQSWRWPRGRAACADGNGNGNGGLGVWRFIDLRAMDLGNFRDQPELPEDRSRLFVRRLTFELVPVNRLAAMVQLIPATGFDRARAQRESDQRGEGYQYTTMNGTGFIMRRRILARARWNSLLAASVWARGRESADRRALVGVFPAGRWSGESRCLL